MEKSSSEITILIDHLNSLHEGGSAVDRLVECGEKAVAPLAEYLMKGQPSHIYQPRQRAVTVLARLGAKNVLIEYLRKQKEISDPVFRFGEEAVENTAARALAKWQTEDVFAVLLRIAKSRTLPGVIEALGTFRRPETIPLFIAALTDDVSRAAAENALRSMGEAIKPALIEAAGRSEDPGDCKTASALLRRRSAVRILADLPPDADEWPALRDLLQEADAEIAVVAACIALKIAPPEDKKAAIETLIETIPHASWYVQVNIENCLLKHFGIAKTRIATEIAQRQTQEERVQASDRVLRILLNARRRAAFPPQ